jgi:broad specificity phosphatase PhoE
LRRQVDTAAGCLAELGLDALVRQDSRWDEYDHLGLVAGGHGVADPPDLAAAARIFQERLDESLLAWLTDGTAVGAMGTWAEFTGRITDAVGDVVAGLPRGGAALVFSSAGVISAVCARLLHLPPAGYLALNRTMANASITKLVSGRSGTTLVSVNEHGHFEGPHRDLLTYR